MYDYHIHSTFSSDGHQSLDDICTTAINLGIKEIAITDHVDKDHPTHECWDLDYNVYMSELEKIIDRYKSKLTIIKGIELGVQPKIIGKLEEYVKASQFDFVIASVHCANNHDIAFEEFHNDKTQMESYRAYLNELLYITENYTEYSVIGHLDLVIRYGNYDDRQLKYNDYRDVLDDILGTIIKNKRGIEVNTSGHRYGLDANHPCVDILKRYKELGGEIITVGSDAHRVEHIGYKLEETYDMLREIGFKYVTKYKKLKPEFIKI